MQPGSSSGVGALIQIVAIGYQNIYLTIDPEISFYRKVWKRYSNFAMETLGDTFTTPPLDLGVRSSYIIPKRGDFLGEMYIQIDLPNVYQGATTTSPICYWTDTIGYKLINMIKLYFNDQLIHKQDKYFYDIYDQFNLSNEQFKNTSVLVGRDVVLYANTPTTIYIPLRFFFTKSKGDRLPLMNMTKTTVTLEVTLESVTLLDLLINIPGSSFLTPTSGTYQTWISNIQSMSLSNNIRILANYYYISDSDKTFYDKTVVDNYLIEQYQTTTFLNYMVGTDSLPVIKNGFIQQIPFVNTVKQLFWTIQQESMASNVSTSLTYMDTVITNAIYIFGQQKVFMDNTYFKTIQPYSFCKRIPTSPIYSYSFALDSSTHEPTGTINMSLTTDTTIRFDCVVGNTMNIVRMGAFSYNILQIQNGTCSILFAD